MGILDISFGRVDIGLVDCFRIIPKNGRFSEQEVI